MGGMGDLFSRLSGGTSELDNSNLAVTIVRKVLLFFSFAIQEYLGNGISDGLMWSL